MAQIVGVTPRGAGHDRGGRAGSIWLAQNPSYIREVDAMAQPIPGAVDVNAVLQDLRDFVPSGQNPDGGSRLEETAQRYRRELSAASGADQQRIAREAKAFLDRNR